MKEFLVLTVWWGVGFWLGASFFCADTMASQQQLAEALRKAQEMHLWQQPGWLRLLHIDPDQQQRGSRIDGGDFFLTPGGGQQPEREGEATLKGLFLPLPVGATADTHLQCRFPARTEFLRQQLHIGQALPTLTCPALQQWSASINADGVSLIFPVGYLNNPASLFGHTFFRLDSREFAPAHNLLSASVGYAANATDEKGVSYAFHGVFGGYRGHFSVMPYYKQAQAYGSLENRDIWEYPLRLSSEQVRQLLYHIWELQQAEFDYYFFDENCAYQMLTLLEAVEPEWYLTADFPWWTIPVDTVRLLQRRLGDEQRIVYRPSRRTQLSAQAGQLGQRLSRLAYDIAQGQKDLDVLDFSRLSEDDQCKVLELAVNTVLVDQVEQQGKEEANTPLLAQLLARRSQLGKTRKQGAAPPTVRPDQGHSTSMLALGGDGVDPASLRLIYRPVLHDLYDLAGGYDPAVQLEFLSPVLDYLPEEQRLRLHALHLVNIVSLPKRTLFVSPVAWSAYLGLAHLPITPTPPNLVGRGRAGWGARIGGDMAFLYGVAGVDLLVSDQLASYATPGFFGETGAVIHCGNAYTLGLQGRLSAYALDAQQLLEVSLVQDLHLDPENAIRLTLQHQRGRSEVNSILLSWRHFFSWP